MGEGRILARAEDGSAVYRCPAGHIHLDYGNVTLRYEEGDFYDLVALINEAAAKLRDRELLNLWVLRESGETTRFSRN